MPERRPSCTPGSQDPGASYLGTDNKANPLIINLHGKSSKDFTYLHQSEMHNSSTVATERTQLGVGHIRNGILSLG